MHELVKERDAAQANVKAVSGELQIVQQRLEAQHKETLNMDKPAMPVLQQPSTAAATASTDRHAPWLPSAERDARSSNSELAALLRRIAINGEVAVAISNRNLASDAGMLNFWCAPTVL